MTDRDDPGSATRLVLHPGVLALGVGCERGVEPEELIGLVATTSARHGLARRRDRLRGLDRSQGGRAGDPRARRAARRAGPVFPAGRLEAETPRLANPSAAVFAATGCHGVAEGAALAAAGPEGALVVAKTKSARATCAIARAPAPLDPDRIGRPQGRLAIVGLGPGGAGWRTPEASALLDDAEDWVGYRGYLDLVERRRGGGCRHAFALGEEEARARRALDLAAAGRRVALVSSGDAGIYAMAALVFELLERGEDPAWQRVAVVVSPGVSALQAAAARAGAPLGHDFCAVSLSDLLTPWPEIERRLEAAAAGDFVTVLYNPASGRRRQRPRARAGDPARRRGRPRRRSSMRAISAGAGETVAIAPLAEFDPTAVDMLSLLIVGSSRTRIVRRPGGRVARLHAARLCAGERRAHDGAFHRRRAGRAGSDHGARPAPDPALPGRALRRLAGAGGGRGPGRRRGAGARRG